MQNFGKKPGIRLDKKGSKGKGKEVVKPKPTTRALKLSIGIAKQGTYFYNCKTEHKIKKIPKYLKDENNEVETSISGIFVIEINWFNYVSQELDTICGSNIFSNSQRLKRSRLLEKVKLIYESAMNKILFFRRRNLCIEYTYSFNHYNIYDFKKQMNK